MTTTLVMPRIMDWTILPAGVIAQAWLDDQYAQRLCENPEAILSEVIVKFPFPKSISFVIVRDSMSLRHLVLPAFKTALKGMSDEELDAVLAEETGGDTSLEWFLPAQVIRKCFRDPDYKTELFADPTKVLDRAGFSTQRHFKILENTENCYHLIVPMSPNNIHDLDFESLRGRLLEVFGAASSKCCATGTTTANL